MTDKDKGRLFREFYCPPRISASGNYYPRYKVQGDSQTGTSHVSYLARPYFSYLVPSCYPGYSKYCPSRRKSQSHIESKILTQTNIDCPCHDVHLLVDFDDIFTNVVDSSPIPINKYENLSYFTDSTKYPFINPTLMILHQITNMPDCKS